MDDFHEFERADAATGQPSDEAYRWVRRGKLPVPARRLGGLILVDVPTPESPGRVAVYARVVLR
jgi:predicted site-specific integrase-resolvase